MIKNIQDLMGGGGALAAITTGMADLFRSNPSLQRVDTVRSERLPPRSDPRYADKKVLARTIETDENGLYRALAIVDLDYLETVAVDMSFKPFFDFGRFLNVPRASLKHLKIKGFSPDYYTDRVTPVIETTLAQRLTLDFPLNRRRFLETDVIHHLAAQATCINSALIQIIGNDAFCKAIRELDIPKLDYEGVLVRTAQLVRTCTNLETLRLGRIQSVPENEVVTLFQAIAESRSIKSLYITTAGAAYDFAPLRNQATLERVSFTYGESDEEEHAVRATFTSLLDAIKTMPRLTALELVYESVLKRSYSANLILSGSWTSQLTELRIRGQLVPISIVEGDMIRSRAFMPFFTNLETLELNVGIYLEKLDEQNKALDFFIDAMDRTPCLTTLDFQFKGFRDEQVFSFIRDKKIQDLTITLSSWDLPKSVTRFTMVDLPDNLDEGQIDALRRSNVKEIRVWKGHDARDLLGANLKARIVWIDHDPMRPTGEFESRVPPDDNDDDATVDEATDEDEMEEGP